MQKMCNRTYDLCQRCRDFGLSTTECPSQYGCKSPNLGKTAHDVMCEELCGFFDISKEELMGVVGELTSEKARLTKE